MLEDKSGNLWFGTDGGGVSKYDGKSFTHYTDKEGLSNNTVRSMLEDKSGNLWFGTNGGGVSKYDGKSFTHYTDKEGMSSNYVWSMLEDKSGNLWLSTEKGLNCFVVGGGGLSTTKLQNGEEKSNTQILVFHKEDGLKAEDFFQNSVLLDSKNRIWWGSGKALTTLNLNEFKLNEKEPEIELENIYLQENFVDYRSIKAEIKDSLITNENEELKNIKFTGVADFHNYPKDLELPYYLNHLTFNFSAIDWSAPHKIKYQYKLEGLDPDWSSLTSDNKADYRNIPYGKYIFKVKAISSANKWSKTFEYEFTIHPPWWHTTWFRVCYVSCFVLLLYLLFRWRTNALRKQKLVLEKTVQERTQELKHEKEIVEEKHKEITDSINYAQRLQQAILATKEEIDRNIPENFLLYIPKDIVAGDFYFFEVTDDFIFYAAADCTGHGVPGAMVSIVCSNALTRSVKEFGLIDPGNILDNTRELILETFKKSTQDVKDGMDISLIAIDRSAKIGEQKIKWAGANNPLWYIDNGEMKEIKADKQPIGKTENPKPFTTHSLPLSLSALFLFTDGYADQFGGEKARPDDSVGGGKKFKYSNLKKLLLENANAEPKIINEKLEMVFNQWKGDLEQVDDVCIIGIRI
jgi:serine phosphatase RsbU (regulator of sigma subunit)